MGFTAGILIEHNLTAVAVQVSNITKPPASWRVGAVPILGLLSTYPKSGYKSTDLIVKSEDVALNGKAF